MPPKRKSTKLIEPTEMPIIKIAPSDLAWLCGMDHYNNLAKCICKIWKQVGADKFHQVRSEVTAQQGYSALDSPQKQIAAIQARQLHTGADRVDVLRDIQALNANRNKTSAELVAAQTEIAKKLEGMDPNTQAKMTQLMTSATNVMHGVHNENNGLDIFTKATGLAVRSTQGTVAGVVYRDPEMGMEWRLNGKYDGLAENGDLVEIKNRQRGLFNTLRDYEECQIQAYLNMLGIARCHLVEVYKGANGQTEYGIIQVDRRPDYMETVVQPWIMKASRFMGLLANDTGLMSEVMAGDVNGRVRDIYNRQ